MRHRMLLTAIALLAVVAGACTIDVERNTDGSLQLSTVMTSDALATELERDPENDTVDVAIQDGVIVIDTAGVERRGDPFVAQLKARLGVSNGVLTVDLFDGSYNGFPIPSDMLEAWEDALAVELLRGANEHDDATLVSVVADDDRVEMEWRIETRESRGR